MKKKISSNGNPMINAFYSAIFAIDMPLSQPERKPNRAHNQPQSMGMVHRVCRSLHGHYAAINKAAHLEGHSFTSRA